MNESAADVSRQLEGHFREGQWLEPYGFPFGKWTLDAPFTQKLP